MKSIIYFFLHDLLYYIHVGMTACLFVCYVHAVALRGQKRVWDLLELELRVWLSYPMLVLGTKPLQEE